MITKDQKSKYAKVFIDKEHLILLPKNRKTVYTTLSILLEINKSVGPKPTIDFIKKYASMLERLEPKLTKKVNNSITILISERIG